MPTDPATISTYGLATLVLAMAAALRWMRTEWRRDKDELQAELKAERESHQKTRDAQLADVRAQAVLVDLVADIKAELRASRERTAA